MFSYLLFFTIMSLFSSDYFMKKIMKISVELWHEKKNPGKNLKKQTTGTFLVVQWL